ncbi:MAG: hypothetical protein ACKVZ0_13815 [Gemmatimonadales bacterium]
MGRLISDDGLESLGRPLLEAGENTRIGVERQRDLRVPNPFRGDLRMLAGRQPYQAPILDTVFV